MKHIYATRTPINITTWIRREARETDAEILVEGDTIVRSEGGIVAACMDVHEDTANLRKAVLSLDFDRNERMLGLQTNSSVFGFLPALPLRRDFCTTASMAHRNARAHGVICEWATLVAKKYEQILPGLYRRHLQTVRGQVLPDWILSATPFTSGVVNRDSMLKYHKDTGNFPNFVSVMIVLRSGANGGRLVLPEYNVKFACSDASLIIFDGQAILHGVTPLKVSPLGYRISIVWYSMMGMRKCQCRDKELAKIRAKRKRREVHRSTKKT